MLFSYQFVRKFLICFAILGTIIPVVGTWLKPDLTLQERILFSVLFLILVPLLSFVLLQGFTFIYQKMK